MKKSGSVVFVLIFLMIASFSAHAQVTKLTTESAFGSNSVKLDFEEYQAETQAADVVGKWGVNFQSVGTGIPQFGLVLAPIGGAEPDGVLQNQAGTANVPLVINFKYPVSRVGFYASGSASTTVTLTAFDPVGATLGSVSETGLSPEKFVGVHSSSVRGIAKLVVDYGTATQPEQIDEIIFEYMSRPKFNTYLAQIADAQDLLQTILVISNLTNSTAKGELRLFDKDGAPLTLKLGEETNSVFPFSIPPFGSKNLTTQAEGELKWGYAQIESNVPVEGTAIFRMLEGETITAEAGVATSVGRPFVVGVVQKVVAKQFDTGIAAVNTTGEPVDARVKLYNEAGDLVGVNETVMDLQPNRQMLGYLSQFFQEYENADFTGTLVVTSDKPIALVMIRTLRGYAESTLPVGSTFQ